MKVTYWLEDKCGQLLFTKKEPKEILGGPWEGSVINGKTYPPKEAVSYKKFVKASHPEKYDTKPRTYKITAKKVVSTNVIPFPVRKPKVRTRLATFVN